LSRFTIIRIFIIPRWLDGYAWMALVIYFRRYPRRFTAEVAKSVGDFFFKIADDLTKSLGGKSIRN
ncbi:hypothetical protein LDY10_20385, partial [Acinetobacter baumannii]|nr:hypothetical protein [Acinetobacter baumannii]